MKKQFYFIGLIAFVFILSACGNKVVEPVAINDATDTCEVCNMAVVDNQHATQIVLENGKSIVFDDVGCMYEWLEGNSNETIAAEFVRDYNDKEWVLVDDATYVYNQSVKTPMAYNVAKSAKFCEPVFGLQRFPAVQETFASSLFHFLYTQYEHPIPGSINPKTCVQ